MSTSRKTESLVFSTLLNLFYRSSTQSSIPTFLKIPNKNKKKLAIFPARKGLHKNL
jgi:hypothetical protein